MPAVSLEWLQPGFWEMRRAVSARFGGRGEALAVETEAGPAVLRRYRRGGHIARILTDQYFFNGYSGSRAFREWRLLAELFELGLSVPRPLVASCERRGLIYRAGLLTARVAAARPLAAVAETLQDRHWQGLVDTLSQFVDAGVVHPDLNANNILLDADDRWYLIDFDRARRVRGPAPARPMIQRLLRSFDRLGIEAGREHLSRLVQLR